MEVKMQTSFIPKKPVVENRSSAPGVSLFFLLAVIIFIITVLLAGGVWFWQKSLITTIENDIKELASARDTYVDSTIEDLIRLDDRMIQSQVLLNKHLAISPVFVLLEKNILRNVRLKTMKFSHAGDDKIKFELTGIATNYDALSKQADAFGQSNLREFISTPVVSDFNPLADGNISFNFSASIYPKLVSYKNISEATVITPADDLISDTP